MIIETIAGETFSQNRIYCWICAVQSKGVKVNIVKTMVMVSKIDQIKSNHPARKNYVAFMAGRQC